MLVFMKKKPSRALEALGFGLHWNGASGPAKPRYSNRRTRKVKGNSSDTIDELAGGGSLNVARALPLTEFVRDAFIFVMHSGTFGTFRRGRAEFRCI
jgi:hypothetical protein